MLIFFLFNSCIFEETIIPMYTSRQSELQLTQIIDHKFDVKINEKENFRVEIEAANVNVNGEISLLIKKITTGGQMMRNWIGLSAFQVWWQLYEFQEAV